MEYGAQQSIFAAYWVLWLVVYVYMAVCLMMIANKTGTANSWMAWIPILNIYLMCKVAGKPGWWLILFLIPIVNIVITIIVWMKISEARKKPGWLGILMIFPFINLIIPGILAFTD